MNRIKYNKIKAKIEELQFNNLLASDKYLVFNKLNIGRKANSLIIFADFLYTNSLYPQLDCFNCPRFVVLDKILIDDFRLNKANFHIIETKINEFFDDINFFVLRSSCDFEDNPDNYSAGISSTKVSNKECLYDSIKELISEMDNIFIDKNYSIIVQELSGNKIDDYIYPTLSAYTNTINYYPGFKADREDPISFFAYGLGNYIAEGGYSYTFSPINNSRTFNDTDQNFYQNYFYAYDIIKNDLKKINDLELNLKNNILPKFIFSSENFNEKHTLFIEICKKLFSDTIQIEYSINIKSEEFEINFLQSKEIIKDNIIEVKVNSDFEDWIVFEKPALGKGLFEFDEIIFIEEFNNSSESITMADIIIKENSKINCPTILIAPARLGSQDSNLGISIKFKDISNFIGIIEYSSENGIENSYGSHFFMNLINSKKPFISCRKEELLGLLTESNSINEEITGKVKKICLKKAAIYVDGNNGLAKIKCRKS